MVVGTEWPLAGQMAVLALLGAGLGGAMTAASTAVMLHAPADRASMAASIEEVAYELGSVLGVTLFGSIMTTVYTRTLVLPADAPAAAQLRDSLTRRWPPPKPWRRNGRNRCCRWPTRRSTMRTRSWQRPPRRCWQARRC